MNNPDLASVAVDPAICPLCHRPNHCRLAAGAPSNQECWCSRVSFPPALLARVPEHAHRRACICEECWRQHQVTTLVAPAPKPLTPTSSLSSSTTPTSGRP